MTKRTVLYDLGAVVADDLISSAEPIGEALDRSEDEVARVIMSAVGDYDKGRISQGVFWEKVAAELGLADTDLLATYALNTATVDQQLLGRIRVQSPTMHLGLVSDATPDWVGHWRKTLELDRLAHVHVIGSDFAEEQTYPDLLRIAAERLQAEPADVWFVDRKPTHLQWARQLGMRLIDLSQDGYQEAFSEIG